MMMRTSYHLQHEEEIDDDAEQDTDTTPPSDPKPSNANSRSKHSETEQRRRNKINHRFQILRDLIPSNDQKRDKASLLLEVIEHIQVLKDKLQAYEGSYQQLWTPEQLKLIPWEGNHRPVDNFGNHSQAMRNRSLDENNGAEHATTTNGPLNTDFSGEFSYSEADLLAGPTTPAVHFSVPFQSSSFAPGRSILPTQNLVSAPQFFSITEHSVLGNEDKAYESSSSSISNAYSQGVMRKLTQALQTSGVDLSQAKISVQLDVTKREKSDSTIVTTTGDVGNPSPTIQLRQHFSDASANESVQAAKRFRT